MTRLGALSCFIACEHRLHERHALPAPVCSRPPRQEVHKAHALSLHAYEKNRE
jgi:hypothetical protein